MWDRDLWVFVLSYKEFDKYEGGYKFRMYGDYKEVFIGYIVIVNWKVDKFMYVVNVWNFDIGVGFVGKLMFMDVNIKEIWQSDNVKELYFNEKG